MFKIGLIQSEADPCLFISEIVICLVYVEDTLFYIPTDDNKLNELRNLAMELILDDDVARFLVVLIEKLENNKTYMG